MSTNATPNSKIVGKNHSHSYFFSHPKLTPFELFNQFLLFFGEFLGDFDQEADILVSAAAAAEMGNTPVAKPNQGS